MSRRSTRVWEQQQEACCLERESLQGPRHVRRNALGKQLGEGLWLQDASHHDEQKGSGILELPLCRGMRNVELVEWEVEWLFGEDSEESFRAGWHLV